MITAIRPSDSKSSAKVLKLHMVSSPLYDRVNYENSILLSREQKSRITTRELTQDHYSTLVVADPPFL
jgi:hypothetical protein